jgi:hypothetical protein
MRALAMPRLGLLVLGFCGLVAACSGEVGQGSTGEGGAAGGPPTTTGEGGTTATPSGGTGGSSLGVAGSGGQVGPGGSNGGNLGNGGSPAPSGVAGSAGAASPSGAAGSAGKGTAGATGKGGAAGAATAGRGGSAVAGKGGTGGGAGAAAVGGGPGGDPAGYVPGLIGVGYGGIRIVSRDGGKTWGDRAYAKTNGGDDGDLLRAVTYGNGLWLATGWKLFTSTDGVNWTDRGQLGDTVKIGSCNIVEGLAYNAGYFFAACSPGNIFRSSDGLTWTKYSTVGGDTGGHMSLTYRGGKFVSYGDTGTSYQSTDGMNWTVMTGIEDATFCQDTFKSRSDCQSSSWYDGAFLRADWQGIISRSTDGKSFTKVYTDDQKNTLYESRAIAAGFVAPK